MNIEGFENMSDIITVENLKKSFGTLDVIKGISFSVTF